MKFPVTVKNSCIKNQTQEEISCCSNELCVTRRNFVLHEEISCHRKIFPVTCRQFLLLEEICCHRKKFAVTWRNLLSQDEIFCLGWKFLLQERIHNLYLFSLYTVEFRSYIYKPHSQLLKILELEPEWMKINKRIWNITRRVTSLRTTLLWKEIDKQMFDT